MSSYSLRLMKRVLSRNKNCHLTFDKKKKSD